MRNGTGGKVARWPLFVFLGVFALAVFVLSEIGYYLNPSAKQTFSRMERRDPKTAQRIIDDYGEELIQIAQASQLLEADEEYFYSLNSSYKDILEQMPQELVQMLQELEERFPLRQDIIALRKGLVGVRVTQNTEGFSYLCYPGGELIEDPVFGEEGTRCLDLGGGWELQMYYCPLPW